MGPKVKFFYEIGELVYDVLVLNGLTYCSLILKGYLNLKGLRQG